MEMQEKRCQPVNGQPTTYRGLHDMACWWEWSIEFETKRVGVFEPFITPGCLCFDIGANRGRKTWIMRHLGARVVAVDPLFHFKDKFVPEFWWKFGEDRGVIPIGKAIANQREISLAINQFIPYVSSMDNAWMTKSAHGTRDPKQPYYRESSLIRRKVPGITLDGLIGIYGVPRFIKVDVEGAENTVLSTLSTPVPALNMEFHRDWIPDGGMRHMETLGDYEWTYALGEKAKFEIDWSTRDGLLTALRHNLTKSGAGSWGDIYGKLVD